jgi:hypothetical protein
MIEESLKLEQINVSIAVRVDVGKEIVKFGSAVSSAEAIVEFGKSSIHFVDADLSIVVDVYVLENVQNIRRESI